jgi:Tfp pilus assembly protein PilX
MAAQFMKAPYQKFKTLPSKQKGAVLLVSVVTLSLLALAGLSTVEQTVVQERTSVNSKAADDATRNAEKGLKQAVADLTSGDVFANTNEACNEELRDENPAMWECEKSQNGYTYVVSYIMNGDQPATDDNGDTIYKVSVVGVRGGSTGGSLATQSLTAGVVVRDVSAVGVWDAAIIGCRQVLFENSVSVKGDVLNTNAIASMMLTDDGAIDGNVLYTDSYTKSQFFTIDGDATLADEAECDPLVVSNVFGTHLSVFADNNQSQNDYEQPTSDSNRRDDTISSDKYYDDFVFRDKKLTFEGTTNIFVQNKLELRKANIDVKNDSDVINIYVGSPDDLDYDGDVLIHDVKFGVKGTLNIYVADEFLLKGTEINFQGTSPQFNVFVGSPNGAAFDGNVEIEESFFIGGGSGRASEEFITIFGLFGDSEVEEPSNVCNGERNGSMTVVDTPNGKTFGGRLYAPRAHICVDDAQFRGSIRGYDVILRDDDTRFVYSVAEELQSSDSDSEVSDYSLLFYTRGDVDFVAGGETACQQTGVVGSSSEIGEAGVDCGALEDSSSEEAQDENGEGQVEDDDSSEEAQDENGEGQGEDDDSSEEYQGDEGQGEDDDSSDEDQGDGDENQGDDDDSSEEDQGDEGEGEGDESSEEPQSEPSHTNNLASCTPNGKGRQKICHDGETLNLKKNKFDEHLGHSADYCGKCD